MKFAAIDIGSNAIRLLLCQVEDDGEEIYLKKNAFLRVPVRLGTDVFETQRISEKKIENLVDGITAFKHLINAYDPIRCAAYATAAMREAENSEEVVEILKQRTGFDVEVIDGRREAEILHLSGSRAKSGKKKQCLLIDVGGGSTEVALILDRKIVKAKAFNLGSLRLLNGTDAKSEWQSLRKWIVDNTANRKGLVAAGSGGSISKIFNLSRIKAGKPLSYNKLKDICAGLADYSLEDRIRVLDLKPDRADVIVPAGSIFLAIMDWAGINKLYVPRLGLVDGIIRVLYDRHKKSGHK